MDVAADSLSFSSNPSAWLLMGMAVMAMIYLTVRPRKRDPLAAAQPFRASLAQQKALERDMQNVIVELSELTRQMSAQLETRAAKLEILIRDADERVADLTATLKAATSKAAASVAPAKPPAVEVAAEPVRGMRLVQDSEDRWNEVYHHADGGEPIGEIARTLGRPRGEIELILALRPKPRPAADVPAAIAVVAVG